MKTSTTSATIQLTLLNVDTEMQIGLRRRNLFYVNFEKKQNRAEQDIRATILFSITRISTNYLQPTESTFTGTTQLTVSICTIVLVLDSFSLIYLPAYFICRLFAVRTF